MSIYTNFFGIDMGKFKFVTSLYGAKSTGEYENSPAGIAQFIQEHHDILPNALCLLETTGGYERDLLYALIEQGFKVHRADTRKVKNFIRSFGSGAKTDALDARALAAYGQERWQKLDLFHPQSEEETQLFQLVQRRADLKITLVAEKNRLKGPSNTFIKDSILALIEAVTAQIKVITEKIESLMNGNSHLKEKRDILQTIPGIGPTISFELLVFLPELGTLCRRKIASLAGVAPRSNDSGKFMGYRKTGHGRNGIKPILFLAALAARNSHSFLRDFYEHLIKRGKKKMVALTALMRKILVIANAKIKDLQKDQCVIKT
jgi:transposase